MILTSKICKGCKIEKPADRFSQTKKSGGSRYYLYPYCRECAAKKSMEWHKANPLKAKIRKAINYAKNKDRECTYARAYRATHKDQTAATDKAYKVANRAKLTAQQNARYKLNKCATPSWLSFIQKAQIMEMYEIAAARGMQTGIKQHVDHIFALRGKGFCGLNVPWNLRVVNSTINVRKHANILPEFASMMWNSA
jgi:hypothetical protein